MTKRGLTNWWRNYMQQIDLFEQTYDSPTVDVVEGLNVGDVVKLARIKENDIMEEIYYQDVMGMKGTVLSVVPDAIGFYYNVQFNKVQRCVRSWHVDVL